MEFNYVQNLCRLKYKNTTFTIRLHGSLNEEVYFKFRGLCNLIPQLDNAKCRYRRRELLLKCTFVYKIKYFAIFTHRLLCLPLKCFKSNAYLCFHKQKTF